MLKVKKTLFNHGLVIGKFYPPHLGHKYLIDYASAKCRKLTVILCYHKSEAISATLRANWLRRIHPHIEILVVEDNKLADEDSKGWANFSLQILGTKPDAVFTSELYGDRYAALMGSIHVLVDKERINIPISATKIRHNPQKYAKFLHPVVRAYFTQRVCVIGAESTGTTTLANALAENYKTVWVPEYGRTYCEGRGLVQPWETQEFIHIAETQNKMEDAYAEISNGLLICDTNSFATGIWHERYLGRRSQELETISEFNPADLYIVTGDEIPFVQDNLRDGEEIRHQMQKRFIERLKEENKQYIIVRGAVEERIKHAVSAINQL